MTAITLQTLTGNQTADRMLTALVGIFEMTFPHLIRAYYLTGSYHDGSAVPASDLDVLIVGKGSLSAEDRQKLRQMDDWCELLCAVPLDIGFFDEGEIAEQYPINLKLSSQLLYGEDIRGSLILPEHSAYIRECMHRAFHRLLWIRHHPSYVAYPLTYPQADDEFYGYVIQRTNELGHPEPPTTERLVGNLLWMATAQLASSSSLYFSNKRDVIKAHQTIFGDEWSNLIESTYQQCRTQWAYHIPQDPIQRAELQTLCAQVLHFENSFLQQYRLFLLNELQAGDEEVQSEAAKRLARIQFEGKS